MSLPPHAPGQRVGLLGGSFNPPHAAHVLISQAALRMLRLDAVWWLVSPGNPLKDTSGLPSVQERIALAKGLISDRRIVPAAIESAFGTRYTIDTLAALAARCPDVRFVWLMGADNLVRFHEWRDWQAIAGLVPIAVFNRPGYGNPALRGRAATTLARWRVDESDAPLLASLSPPAWVFIHGPKSTLSSTALRQKMRAR